MYRNGLLALLTALLCCSQSNAARIVTAEAFAAEPYGVGHIVLMLDSADANICATTTSWEVRDPTGRTHYPVFTNDKLAKLFELLTGERLVDSPTRVECFFLFTGNRPLQLSLYTPEKINITLTPALRPRGHRRVQRRWWRERQNAVTRRKRVTDYPPLADKYLSAMLAAKLNIRANPVQAADWSPKQAIGLLLSSEKQHMRAFSEVVQGCSDCEVAALALPEPRTWSREALPEFEQAEIEEIAEYVPDDCFYARFGKFSNFFWLMKLTEEYGGDLTRMVTLRGSYPRYGERIQEQLGIKELPFAEQLGDTFIQDMAFIGRDAYLGEGAAVGVVLYSKNPLFTAGLGQLRKDLVKKFKKEGAQLENVDIDGTQVSLLSTPGNRLLSYYVRRGKYNLVTNCRQIAEDFLAIEGAKGSIASDPEFQFARSHYPVGRNDTVFAYVPRKCLEQIATPEYQIETYRRLRSVAEMEALQLARLAYGSDTRRDGKRDPEKLAASPGELKAGGYLPASFGQRPDGSTLMSEGGKVWDSMRGMRGSFLPIPDVEVTAATTREAAYYASLKDYFSNEAPALSPIYGALRRELLSKEDSTERLTFDARIAPFRRSNYRFATTMLGEPTTERVAGPENSVAYANFVVRGQSLSPSRKARHITVTMPDLPPDIGLRTGGLLSWLTTARGIPFTISATNDVELLQKYRGLLGDRDDAFGYAQLPFRLWRRRMQDYTAYSFNQARLTELATPIPLVDESDLAQLRVSLRDLGGSQFSESLNAIACDRALRASIGNAQMVHDLSNQFHIPRAESLPAAERLLNTELICSLGGAYEVIGHQGGLDQWTSTAWECKPQVTAANANEYTAPLLRWLRGLELTAAVANDQATLHGHIDMERVELPKEPGKRASIFDLFKGN